MTRLSPSPVYTDMVRLFIVTLKFDHRGGVRVCVWAVPRVRVLSGCTVCGRCAGSGQWLWRHAPCL